MQYFFLQKIKLVLITLHRLKNNFHFRSLEQDFGFKIQVVEKVGNTKLAKAKLYIFFFWIGGGGRGRVRQEIHKNVSQILLEY